MADVLVKSITDMKSYRGEGRFVFAGMELGVTAWGMNVLRMPANWEDYPEHDHAEDRQEEVYVVLEGSATLEADGETFELSPGTFARVGPAQRRKIRPGPAGATVLALGGEPGAAYKLPEWLRKSASV